jgi:hypothetical protein
MAAVWDATAEMWRRLHVTFRQTGVQIELRTPRFLVVFPNSYPGSSAQKPDNQANFQGSLTHHPQPKESADPA